MDRTEPGIDMAAPSVDPTLEAGSVTALGLPRVGDVTSEFQAPRPRLGSLYAALDLGTNNCRLLIARQPLPGDDPGNFRIVDSFCRIVRLGEGVSQGGRLSEAAIARTIAALRICREKMQTRRVTRARLIATEACRAASNSDDFLARVTAEAGLKLEIVDRETEAMLATAGCSSLADPDAESVVLFDIGGGSSEIVWLRGPGSTRHGHAKLRDRVRAWDSLKLGVVSLAERFGGRDVTPQIYQAMVAHVLGELAPFAARVAAEPRCGRFHLLGTSGTVTTIAGVHLGLVRYDRRKVDGLWMSEREVATAVADLRGMSFEERALNGCIGTERADLVLAGCAIFEAIRRTFPAERVRIADRGLREGILMEMMASDRIWSRDGF